jgi:hypothetical protein
MKYLLSVLLIFCMAIMTQATGYAEIPGQRIETVQFAPGSSTKTIKGSLKGDMSVDYMFRAGAGQTLDVTMKRSNLQNYFNIIAPGAGNEALFVGQTGEGFRGVLADEGDYTIRVYLMRSAARRNETSNYSLTISLAGEAIAALPASKDALVQGTRFHASASILCKPPFEDKTTNCDAGVIRRGFDGTATVEVRLPSASPRHILFIKGKPVASDAQSPVTFTRRQETSIVRMGDDEWYEIPDALITGG